MFLVTLVDDFTLQHLSNISWLAMVNQSACVSTLKEMANYLSNNYREILDKQKSDNLIKEKLE
jgi:hypothetical protein